jgi:hypothetical protein
MNKKIRLLAALILISLTGILIMEKLDKRDFKFEGFKTSEELQVFLEQKFPVNSNANKFVSFLKRSEGSCTIIHRGESGLRLPKDCEYVFQCEGSTGWFSLKPLESYRVIIFSKKDNSIISFSAERIRKLII